MNDHQGPHDVVDLEPALACLQTIRAQGTLPDDAVARVIDRSGRLDRPASPAVRRWSSRAAIAVAVGPQAAPGLGASVAAACRRPARWRCFFFSDGHARLVCRDVGGCARPALGPRDDDLLRTVRSRHVRILGVGRDPFRGVQVWRPPRLFDRHRDRNHRSITTPRTERSFVLPVASPRKVHVGTGNRPKCGCRACWRA